MSFMLSCSSKRRFSIFRSLQDKEKKMVNARAPSVLTLDNLSRSHNGKEREEGGRALRVALSQTDRQTAPPVRVMLADLSGSFVFLKSSSFRNPVIQLSNRAIPA